MNPSQQVRSNKVPKQGDIKTFPNGKRGVWDGQGWEHVPSPTEDAVAAPPAVNRGHADDPYVGDHSTEPGTFWGGATKHMLTEEPAALGALGVGAAMGAGALGLGAGAVTAATSAAPALGHGVTRLARLLAGKEQVPFGPGEAFDIVSGPGMTYGPRALGGVARGVANSPVGQKLISTLTGTTVGSLLGHPYIGTHLGATSGASGAVGKVAEAFSSAGEGAPGASMAKLHEFLTGGRSAAPSQLSEAERAGMRGFDPGVSPSSTPRPTPSHVSTPTPTPSAPRVRVSRPTPGGNYENIPTRDPMTGGEVMERPSMNKDLPGGEGVWEHPTPQGPPKNLTQTHPTDPKADWQAFKDTTKPKRTGSSGESYKAEDLRPKAPKPKKVLEDEFSPAMQGLEKSVPKPPGGPVEVDPTWYPPGLGPKGSPTTWRKGGTEFPEGWTGTTKNPAADSSKWQELGREEAERGGDSFKVRNTREKIRQDLNRK